MKQLPKIYFGLHFCPGVAQYDPPGEQSFRVFLNEDTIRSMNPTFKGLPVFVKHVDKVDLAKLENQADGYVIKSFYNEADGKTWAQFMAVSDEAHDAITRGWKLSNAYVPTQYTNGGKWNGVDYAKEITGGRFTHLAIVDDPRYEESIILDEEAFKKYNESKASELKRVQNSKDKKKETGIMFFNKKQLENASEFEGALVTLKNGKDVSIKELVALVNAMEEPAKAEKPEESKTEKVAPPKGEKMNAGEDGEQEQEEPVMANGEHMVKLGDEHVTVNDLVGRHMAMKDCMNGVKKNDMEKPAADKLPAEQEKPSPAMKNAADTTKKTESKFSQVSNARAAAPAAAEGNLIELSSDRLDRGKSRYGSSK